MVDRASNDRPGQHPSGTAPNTQEAAAAFAQTRAQGGPSNAERRSSHNGPEVGSRRSGASASGGQQNVQTALESAVQQRDRDGERRQGDDRDRTEMMRRSQDAVGRRQVAPFVPQGSSTIEALALGGSAEPSAHRDIENMSRDEARDFLLGVVRPNLQAGLAQAAQVQLPQAPPPDVDGQHLADRSAPGAQHGLEPSHARGARHTRRYSTERAFPSGQKCHKPHDSGCDRRWVSR